MPNPPLLLCDSDALVQFFLVDEVKPLRHLKDNYGVQPTITQEVDLELRWIARYKDRFVPQLQKALRSGTLQLLDPPTFQPLMSGAPLGASWESFQALGAQYAGPVQRGEAYTFAAALTLGLPALSNDFRAIQTLENNLRPLPSPVIRGFDLLVFAYQTGALDLKTCNDIRSELLKNKEGIPKAFKNASFEDGLLNFSSRLKEEVAGISVTAGVPTFRSTLYISKI